MPSVDHPVWAAVDALLETTVISTEASNRAPHTASLSAIKTADAAGAANGLPAISVIPAHGKLLMLLARVSQARHILEVGTLAGSSAIWLAHANPEARVTTIEVSPHAAAIAQKNVNAAGLADRIDIRVGSGADQLEQLLHEIKRGESQDKDQESGKAIPRFDFSFIDADKPNNYTYFDYAVKCSRPGAVVVVDNVVLGGGIIDKAEIETSTMAAGAIDVLTRAGSDSRVDATVVQTVGARGYDGFMLAVVR